MATKLEGGPGERGDKALVAGPKKLTFHAIHAKIGCKLFLFQ